MTTYRSDTKEDAICRALADFGVACDRKLEDVAATIIAALRESGWIIVRHDAIRLAQAHARDFEYRGGGEGGPVTEF